jgi:hypothetical protein
MVPNFPPIKPEPRMPTFMVSSLETGPFLQALRIPRSLDRDLGGGAPESSPAFNVLVDALRDRG